MDVNKLHEAALAGGREAEEQLFQELTARFQLFARQRLWDRADADEVVQEAIMTVLEKYREIEFETSFAAWCYRVLNNKLLTFSTTKGRRERIVQEQIEHQRGPAWENPGDLESRLLECMRKLNRAHHRHARIMNLHYQGYSVEEICTRLGLTRSNFYSILSRARSYLSACLEEGAAQ